MKKISCIKILTLFLSLSLSLYPSIHQSIDLSTNLSIYRSIYQSIYLSIYLSICVSIYYYVIYHIRYFTVNSCSIWKKSFTCVCMHEFLFVRMILFCVLCMLRYCTNVRLCLLMLSSWARTFARQFAFSLFYSVILKFQAIIWSWKIPKPEKRNL